MEGRNRERLRRLHDRSITQLREAEHAARRGLHGAERVVRDRVHDAERAVRAEVQQVRLRATLAIALALVGFLLVAQWRGTQSATSPLAGKSDSDLAQLVQEMTAQNASLRSEVMGLELQIARSSSDQRGRAQVLAQAARELADLRTMSGTDPMSGPGVKLVIDDSKDMLLARDLVDVVGELRNAGAEGVSVGGRRVGSLFGFGEAQGRLTFDGRPIARKVVFEAIGDRDEIVRALSMPGGLVSTLEAFPGVSVALVPQESVDLPAVAAPPSDGRTAAR